MPMATRVTECVETFCNLYTIGSEQHVEMRISRRKHDGKDIHCMLQWFSSHFPFPVMEELMSLSTGRVGNSTVNCFKAESVGKQSQDAMVGRNFENLTLKRGKCNH